MESFAQGGVFADLGFAMNWVQTEVIFYLPSKVQWIER